MLICEWLHAITIVLFTAHHCIICSSHHKATATCSNTIRRPTTKLYQLLKANSFWL